MNEILMLDDDAGGDAPAELYAETLAEASGGAMGVTVAKPGLMSETIALIADRKPSCLLLDVALTNALTAEGLPLGYDGIALAQQIRTLQTRGRTPGGGGLPGFPIVRLSKRDVIAEYVSGDPTSDDLFDERIDKDELVDTPDHAATRILALARDYPAVLGFADRPADETGIADLLACDEALIARLDSRTLLPLRRHKSPPHVTARFISAILLGRPGPLVDEALVAIRLGVDAGNSQDWQSLLNGLDSAKYRGAFASGYPRWWMPLIMDWWQREIDSDRSLARLGAHERVQKLSEVTGLNDLRAIEPTVESPGSRVWHRCLRSGRPVDPSQAFPLLPEWGIEAWHDVEYLCLDEALRDRRNPRLSATERTRLEAVEAVGNKR